MATTAMYTPRRNMRYSAHMSFPVPAADEVVIQHSAIALEYPKSSQQNTTYPRQATPSQNVVGTIVQVGENVTRFLPGQRVMAYRQQSKAGSVSHAGLQRFSTVPQALVSVIPNSLEFQEAATLPLSITLAAVGLYQKNHLNLPLPRARSEETREDAEAEHTILVINGASEIGSLAIQLATASGVRVIATASQTDANFVRSLGASVVVDEPGAPLAEAFSMNTVQLSGIFDTRSTEESFAQIDALLQDIVQSPRVCAVNPPAHPPRSFVPTVAISSTINRTPYAHIRSALWGEFLPAALASGQLRVRSRKTATGLTPNSTLEVKESSERQRADSAVTLSCD